MDIGLSDQGWGMYVYIDVYMGYRSALWGKHLLGALAVLGLSVWVGAVGPWLSLIHI